MPGPQAGTW
ncbi:MAG: hypothetical protein RLZZ144_227, partial [Pseudomonadota bacterium]